MNLVAVRHGLHGHPTRMKGRSLMNVMLTELGRIGDETKGNPDLWSPDLEVWPKFLSRNVFVDDLSP